MWWVYVYDKNGYYKVDRLKDLVGPVLGIFVTSRQTMACSVMAIERFCAYNN